jgi:hypothetical protein
MAEIHNFRRPPQPRRPFLNRNKLAWLLLLAGAFALVLSQFVEPLRGLGTLIAFAVMLGGYAGLYDRTRG